MGLNFCENLENTQNPEKDYSPEILTQIAGMYPFLNDNERENFLQKATEIEEVDPIIEISKILKLLNNPHASIKECSENNAERDAERKYELDPTEKPTGEIIEDILYMKVPTFRGVKLEDLEDAFLKYEKESNGLIIDLRDNGGGQSDPGWKFARKYFLNQGNHFINTRKQIHPEGGIDNISMYVQSDKDPIYNKPIAILTSNKTFSSAETFVSIMRACSNCTIIGTETRGGSANPIHEYIKIKDVNYRVSIPIWRVILPDQNLPLEETKMKPDIYYDEDNIVDFAIKYIKDSEK